MNLTPKSPVKTLFFMALLALTVSLLGAAGASAQVRYLGDGGIQNANGGWDLPAQGSCPQDPTKATRPECLALRLTTTYTTSSACAPSPAPVSGAVRSWTTGGVCNDLVNTTETACNLAPDRLWNGTDGICAVVMKGDDRNNVVCALHGGTWVTTGTCIGAWVMPNRDAYAPKTLTSGVAPAPAGTGDQCLRCHNADTQYNGARVRDVENTFYTGHKNMVRKVGGCSDRNYHDATSCAANGGTWGFQPWGGPPFSCSNPAYTDEQTCEANGATWDPTIYVSDDSGNPFSWGTGQVTVSGTARDLTWIYGDWIAPLPRSIYKGPAGGTANTCSDPRYTAATCVANGGTLLKPPAASYSCGRCHATGWSSDATINANKEPERSFPGITWDRNSDAGFGKVNMSGGLTNDPNKYSSWDVWGISCSRCHNSAVDESIGTCYIPSSLAPDSTACTGAPYSATWQTLPAPGICFKSSTTPAVCSGWAGTTFGAPFSSPTGMSSHHSDLTGPTVSTSGDKGYCTDPRFSTLATCNAVGAAWLTQCSIAGVCSLPAYTTSGTCVANAGTWTSYNTSALCTGASGTWQPDGSCSVAGVCVNTATGALNPAITTSAACTPAPLQWAAATDIVRCVDVHEYGKEHGIAAYEAARYTGTKTNRGQVITRLCMDCHRQETGGYPYADASAAADLTGNNHPGNTVKVGPAHGTVGVVSHPAGNMFLNSPHARFNGTFNEVATAKNNNAGPYSGYRSWFMTDGEAANTGNGCTGCHDVHESVAEESSPFPSVKEECTECHSGTHAVSLTKIKHGGGPGTPLEHAATKPAEACEICHMPEGLHLWRINPAATYSTFPPAALTAVVNANTVPESSYWGSYDNAVWVDVDYACGQCHGGGSSNASTTGTIASGTKSTLTVTSAAGFYVGARVKVAGAGALEIDGVTRDAFETYVSGVSGTTITLAGAATVGVTNAAVAVNPTRSPALYRTKAALALMAYGMHTGESITPPFTDFTYVIATPARVVVDVDGSTSTCGGAACTTFSWSWGDGTTTTGASATANHDYSAQVGYVAGPKVVTLTASRPGVGGSVSKTLSIGAPTPPNATATCSMNANTWVETVSKADLPPTGINQVTANWGDGTLLSSAKPPFANPLTFTHTYLNPPPASLAPNGYTVAFTVIDSSGRFGRYTCTTGMYTYFYLGGTVMNGAVPVSGAVVSLKKGATSMGSMFTNASGQFSFGTLAAPALKPGAYTLTVTKLGMTFTPQTWTVGPSKGDVAFANGTK